MSNAPASAAGDRRHLAAVLGLSALALAVRLSFLLDPTLSHASDMSFFLKWCRSLATHSLADFPRAESFCDYPPLALLLMSGIGEFAAAWHGSALSDAQLLRLWKMPAVVADVAIGFLLYAAARRGLGRGLALGAAALYWLNPAAIYNSAYWGQIDAIPAAFALASLLGAARSRWCTAGACIGAALLLKFQSIAFAPLVILEAYRAAQWRGLARLALGSALCAAVVLAPFAWQGVLSETLRRAYVDVVGQYPQLSKGAFNLWALADQPEQPDTAAPYALLAAISGGQPQLQIAGAWFERLTWRTISLAVFALAVAIVLSLYSLRPGEERLFGAGGLLGLAFFLFPTEMHERYALPALAVLPVWAVSSAWRERAYWLLTVLVVLNLSAQLPADAIARQLGGACVVLFVLLAGALRGATARAAPEASTPAALRGNEPRLLPLLRWTTAAACVAALGAAAWVGLAWRQAAQGGHAGDAVLYLSALEPTRAEQGFGKLRADRAVSGAVLRIGPTVYLRGLGTHAPAQLEYRLPEGWTHFAATIGMDAGALGRGSARVRIELDGKPAYSSPVLRPAQPPLDVQLELGAARRITILVDATSDGRRHDHVNLALARLIRIPQADSAGGLSHAQAD